MSSINTGSIFDSILASLIVALIGMIAASLSKTFRNLAFYRQHTYVLDYDKLDRIHKWDIQWENKGLTIKPETISNDNMKNVEFKLRADGRKYVVKRLTVSQEFQKPKKWPLQFRIGSIVRDSMRENSKRYKIYFIVRVRRW